ncbi:MAG: hypothetical protein D6678_01690 [Zetaproteobacteria bacterium]|nr:MAG: hypothetical protein D6678_01690 [Zetaproteobacteria bacterium]
MRSRKREGSDNFYEIFSDMALLMLAAFIFMFVMILINAKLQGGDNHPTKKEMEALQQKLAAVEERNQQLQEEMNTLAGTDVSKQMEKVLRSAGLDKGKARHDFDMFVSGLRKLPGEDLHLVVDATGSMHGVTTFLIPILRVIAIRSGKRLAAVTWYADRRLGTYHGSMGEMFDNLMQNAPFVGTDETIGYTFHRLAEKDPVPGAYLLIGDEPPTDTIHYHEIPAPVFTLPLGFDNESSTRFAYSKLAEETGGRMLILRFR